MLEIPLYKTVSLSEYNIAKESGTLPFATVTTIRGDEPNADGIRPVFNFQVVIDEALPWTIFTTKKGNGDFMTGEQLQYWLSMIKIATGSVLDVLHVQREAVLEPGLQVFGFDPKRPQANGGRIAAWARNPKFVEFAPASGWRSLIWRNEHFSGGPSLDWAGEAQADYMDLLVKKASNFGIDIPVFLAPWAEVMAQRFEESAEEALKNGNLAIQSWRIRKDAYQTGQRQIENGSVPTAADLFLNAVDGTTLNLASVKTGEIVYFYRPMAGKFVYSGYSRWDGTEQKRATISGYVKLGQLASLVLID